MILLYNVYLTPDVSSYNLKYHRGLLPSFDKFEILKYSLSSLAVIPWEKAYINIELGYYYKIFESAIKEYVEKEFSNINFIYSNKRAKTIKEWQKFANILLEDKDKILWYAGNHDHIFLAKNLDYIDKIENLLNTVEPFSYVIHSHRFFTRYADCKLFEEYTNYTHLGFDAMCCVKCQYFWEYWHSFDCSNLYIPRSDWTQVAEHNINWSIYSYHQLLCEHFDGSHIFAKSDKALNNDPPLTIPENFFNNNIKIKFGSPEPGYFTFNPLATTHKVIDYTGVDSFGTLDDIPYFWKNRISEIKIDTNIDMKLAKQVGAIKKVKALYPYEFENSNVTKRQVELLLAHKNVFGIKQDFIEELKNKL